MAAGAVGFLTDQRWVVRQALVETQKNNTLSACMRKNPNLNGILGFNEHILFKSIFIAWRIGVAEYSMIARDVMMPTMLKAHMHIQHLSKAESVRWSRWLRS